MVSLQAWRALGTALLIGLGIAVIMVIEIAACKFIIFLKLGSEGWKGIIPLYNTYILGQLLNREYLSYIMICISIGAMFIHVYAILVLMYIVNLVASAMFYGALSVRFGRSKEFGILGAFLPFIFFPIIAMSDPSY